MTQPRPFTIGGGQYRTKHGKNAGPLSYEGVCRLAEEIRSCWPIDRLGQSMEVITPWRPGAGWSRSWRSLELMSCWQCNVVGSVKALHTFFCPAADYITSLLGRGQLPSPPHHRGVSLQLAFSVADIYLAVLEVTSW
ncbi:hypothetical protein J6590_029848 [Homalodisca vitripennis]|nr:hypothetical protein J6590_029848 [Homalodisca vitripennis]